MKRTFMNLLMFTALSFTANAVSAQTTQTTAHVDGLRFNCSDHHIPPVVLHYLKEHPKVAKKVIAYYKEHGHLPPRPPQFPTLSAPLQQTASIGWPQSPNPPASIPVTGGKL